MELRLDRSLTDPAGFSFWTPIVVRFSDLDLLGHANNVRIAGWLEDGRVALELPIQPCTPDYDGPVVVLVDFHIQYLAEVRLGDEVAVGTRVQRIGTSSITLGQAVFVNGRCAAIAESVEVLIGATSRRPEGWPPKFLAHFEQYLVGLPDGAA